MMSPVRRAHVAAGLVLLAAVALVGCSGEESSESDRRSRESSDAKGVSIDSVEGACSTLVGPAATFVDDSLAAGRAVVDSGGAADDVDLAANVQDSLFKITATGPDELRDATGQLVDYLDDPSAYVTDGALDPLVTGAVDDIEEICAG